MNQSVGVIVGIVGNTNGLAHLKSRREAGVPEIIVNLHVRERQYADGNRAFLIVPNCDKIARIGHHTHYFALLDSLVNTGDST